MVENSEFETLKDRLRELKEIKRKEKDVLKLCDIDDKIDKYQDKIDIIKKKYLEKGLVEGKNGFEPAIPDDNDDFDDENNSNKPINKSSYFVMCIFGIISVFVLFYLLRYLWNIL